MLFLHDMGNILFRYESQISLTLVKIYLIRLLKKLCLIALELSSRVTKAFTSMWRRAFGNICSIIISCFLYLHPN